MDAKKGEIAILKKLRHPNTLRLYEVLECNNSETIYMGKVIGLLQLKELEKDAVAWTSREDIGLILFGSFHSPVFELCDGGELVKFGKTLSEAECKHDLRQMLYGLEYRECGCSICLLLRWLPHKPD